MDLILSAGINRLWRRYCITANARLSDRVLGGVEHHPGSFEFLFPFHPCREFRRRLLVFYRQIRQLSAPRVKSIIAVKESYCVLSRARASMADSSDKQTIAAIRMILFIVDSSVKAGVDSRENLSL